MIYDEKYVRPLLITKHPAIEKARAYYKQFSDLDFEKDLLDYLAIGWVYNSPSSFAMACIIDISKDPAKLEPAWFIRMVIGNFGEVINGLWFQQKTEWIIWCRNNEDGGTRLRKFKMARLFAVAKGRLKGKQHGRR